MPATMAAWGGATLTVTVDDVDVSCDVLACTVDRSKNRLWDPPDAGTCQIVLDLSAGAQPSTRGPVGVPVVVHIAYGAVDRNLFTGNVQLRRLEATPHSSVLILDCVDGFERLGRVNVRADVGATPVGGGETPAQRIARWLNVADWDVGARDLDSSTYTCPATVLDGNVLVQIQAATLADGGEFFIDGDGIATFYAWAWRTAGGTVAAVFSDRRLHDWVPYSSAILNDDLDEVQNQVSGTRRAVDDEDVPVVQTVENTGSVTAYGPRGDSLDNLELEDDTQVADRVTALVAIAGGPSPRFDSIVVQPAFDPSRMWPRVIPCTFGSLVAANRVWPDGIENAYYGHILGEVWTFTPDDATVTWRVSGTGSWDAHSPPRPPIRVEITPGGCIRIPDGLPCDDTYDVIFRDADGDPIGDPFPPGSLCGEGICEIPDGAAEVCFVNDFGTSCVPIDDPRLTAILWFDVLEPGPSLYERIDGDAIDDGPGYAGTAVLDEIPGGFDAMYGIVAGGVIGAGHSTRVEEVSLAGGWTVDWWMYLVAHTEGFDTILSLDSPLAPALEIRLDEAPLGEVGTRLSVAVWEDGETIGVLSGPIAVVPVDADWHHYVVTWDPAVPGFELVAYIDGVEQ